MGIVKKHVLPIKEIKNMVFKEETVEVSINDQSRCYTYCSFGKKEKREKIFLL